MAFTLAEIKAPLKTEGCERAIAREHPGAGYIQWTSLSPCMTWMKFTCPQWYMQW